MLLACGEPCVYAEFAEEMLAGELDGYFFAFGGVAVIGGVVLLADIAGWGCGFGQLFRDEVAEFVFQGLHLSGCGYVWVVVGVAPHYDLLETAALLSYLFSGSYLFIGGETGV